MCFEGKVAIRRWNVRITNQDGESRSWSFHGYKTKREAKNAAAEAIKAGHKAEVVKY